MLFAFWARPGTRPAHFPGFAGRAALAKRVDANQYLRPGSAPTVTVPCNTVVPEPVSTAFAEKLAPPMTVTW
jgi:hypothetical protein